MFLFQKRHTLLLVATIAVCTASLVSAASIYDDAIAYYPFEGTGTTVTDTSLTTAIDLTINGTYTRTTDGCAGNALTLDDGSYVTSGMDIDALDLGRDGAITVASWIKIEGSDMAIASKMESSGNYRGWWFYRSTHGTLDFLLRSENDVDSRLWVQGGEYDASSIGQGEWAHVAATFSYDSVDELRGIRLYLNGEALDATLFNNGLSTLEATDNTIPFNLAGRNDTGKGYGSLDELAIWNRVLSASEIQEVYSLGQLPPRPEGNLLTNGDFEDTTDWGMPGTTSTPANWTTDDPRKNAASQASGTGAIGGSGTSAFMEPFMATDNENRREIRQITEVVTLPEWQFDMDFASETIYSTTDRSLSMSLQNEVSGLLAIRLVDSDGNGVGDIQIYDSGWQDISELQNSIQFDTNLYYNPLTHHLTVVGHYDDETPSYDITITDSNDNEFTATGLTGWLSSAPSTGDGLGGVEFNTFNSVYAYLIDNVSIVDLVSSPDIPGDANNDGKVDGSDVTILANNWQAGVGDPDPETVTWEMGDFNGDGQVDGSDVTILANNWQYGVTVSTASVPEPGSFVFLMGGLLFGLLWRKRNPLIPKRH